MLDPPGSLAGAPLGLEGALAQLAQCQAALAALRDDEELSPGEEVALTAISVGLVVFAGLMAGLTLGLLSLDRWVLL